jgi:TetR/AcrR family transcriptional regulator
LPTTRITRAATKTFDVEPPHRGVLQGDPTRTKRIILEAANREFAEHSFAGARIDRIAQDAQVNKQALYYHYGTKDKLFEAVLENAYHRFYEGYADLRGISLPPAEHFRALLSNLFDVMVANPDIFAILLDENRMKGRHLPNVVVRRTARKLIRTIEEVLNAGKKHGVFRAEIDADQLWMSVLALCIFNFSHSYTISNILNRDVSKREALAKRKAHVIHFVMSAISVP